MFKRAVFIERVHRRWPRFSPGGFPPERFQVRCCVLLFPGWVSVSGLLVRQPTWDADLLWVWAPGSGKEGHSQGWFALRAPCPHVCIFPHDVFNTPRWGRRELPVKVAKGRAWPSGRQHHGQRLRARLGPPGAGLTLQEEKSPLFFLVSEGP